MGRGTQGTCPLCGRVCDLTFHHLIPRKLHRRIGFKKRYTRAQLDAGIAICRLCHSGLHDLHDEMTLARDFDSLQALRADPAISRHCAWVAKQKVRDRERRHRGS
ncbi:MAG: hypothetical protein ACOCXJ_05315 [Planctomycetota bacterium]